MPFLLMSLILADAAPSGTVLGIAAAVLLALIVGLLVISFFVIRAIVRFVRRRTALGGGD